MQTHTHNHTHNHTHTSVKDEGTIIDVMFSLSQQKRDMNNTEEAV